eukprot:jgi/Psemu1/20642/gm1.20642_g
MTSPSDDEENQAYPQPSSGDEGKDVEPYRYIRYENAEATYFPDKIPLDTLVWVLMSKGRKKCSQLHKRARVLSEEPDEEGRIQVQYPSGSTYRVRRKNLMPAFEHLNNLIMVASETNDYRRMSIVHTREEDHFIAKERYPDQKFLLGDVFEDKLQIAPKNPLIVSIDINGNRELQADHHGEVA